MNLNGFDVEEAKILRLSGKPQNAPEGMMQGLFEGLGCRDLRGELQHTWPYFWPWERSAGCI